MKTLNLKNLSIIVGLVPILFFIYYVWQFTINVPFLDDNLYYTKAVVDVNKSQSFAETFKIFMRQHTITEHKTPVSRIAAFLIYKITGKLNFFTFAQIGNLTLFGILISLLAILPKTRLEHRLLSANSLFIVPNADE